MEDSVLKFCPKCFSLFSYLSEDDTLFLQCKSCGYRTSTDDDSKKEAIRVKYITETDTGVKKYALPSKQTKYDNTMFHTSRIPCNNTECPSLDPSNWDLDGKNLPNILLYNQPEENRTMYMTCAVCGTSWRVANKELPEAEVEPEPVAAS